jgi:hypothetical protein
MAGKIGGEWKGGEGEGKGKKLPERGDCMRSLTVGRDKMRKRCALNKRRKRQWPMKAYCVAQRERGRTWMTMIRNAKYKRPRVDGQKRMTMTRSKTTTNGVEHVGWGKRCRRAVKSTQSILVSRRLIWTGYCGEMTAQMRCADGRRIS